MSMAVATNNNVDAFDMLCQQQVITYAGVTVVAQVGKGNNLVNALLFKACHHGFSRLAIIADGDVARAGNRLTVLSV